MNNFWKRDHGKEAMDTFNGLVFCDFSAKTVTILNPLKFNEFESKFLIDLGTKWVNGALYPAKWSSKQKALVHKLSQKGS